MPDLHGPQFSQKGLDLVQGLALMLALMERTETLAMRVITQQVLDSPREAVLESEDPFRESLTIVVLQVIEVTVLEISQLVITGFTHLLMIETIQ